MSKSGSPQFQGFLKHLLASRNYLSVGFIGSGCSNHVGHLSYYIYVGIFYVALLGPYLDGIWMRRVVHHTKRTHVLYDSGNLNAPSHSCFQAIGYNRSSPGISKVDRSHDHLVTTEGAVSRCIPGSIDVCDVVGYYIQLEPLCAQS